MQLTDILSNADFRNSSKPVKRIAVGAKVLVDASGSGDWVVGVVGTYDAKAKMVTLFQAGTGDEVQVRQPQMFRINDSWWKTIQDSFNEDEACAAIADDLKAELEIEQVIEQELEEEDGDDEGGSVVKARYKARYVTTHTNSGRLSLHNGDAVAKELAGLAVEDSYKYVAEKTNHTAQVSDMAVRWSHLNKGQQRMLLGNFYRAWLRDFGDAESKWTKS